MLNNPLILLHVIIAPETWASRNGSGFSKKSNKSIDLLISIISKTSFCELFFFFWENHSSEIRLFVCHLTTNRSLIYTHIVLLHYDSWSGSLFSIQILLGIMEIFFLLLPQIQLIHTICKSLTRLKISKNLRFKIGTSLALIDQNYTRRSCELRKI